MTVSGEDVDGVVSCGVGVMLMKRTGHEKNGQHNSHIRDTNDRHLGKHDKRALMIFARFRLKNLSVWWHGDGDAWNVFARLLPAAQQCLMPILVGRALTDLSVSASFVRLPS